VGRHDWICPVDQAEEIHKLIPHSELSIFEASGHSPQIEERDAVRRAPEWIPGTPRTPRIMPG
jgi:pimeloyl-ACP methyl ester carboxylesterase